tara:strand:- start:2010 stop:2621 length:612 start_codon:yes stop_codon:yes gene_type:complete
MSIFDEIKQASADFAKESTGMKATTEVVDVAGMAAAEQEAIKLAFGGKNDTIKVNRVLARRKGRSTPIMITSFHPDDEKQVEFDYESRGQTYKAITRVFWYEDNDGVQGFGYFPVPLELSASLTQGSWLNINLHKIPAGVRVLHANADMTEITATSFPAVTYAPALGGAFTGIFHTTATQLQAVLSVVKTTITASTAKVAEGA